MSLWKVNFDHKNGETRQCKECNVSFYTKKPRWRCNVCVNAAQKLYEGGKRNKYERKEPYPYCGTNHNYHQRFYPLRAKLHKMKVREEWQPFFKEKLDEILADELLMKWINDRRDEQTKNEKKSKSKRIIQRDTPDTRGYHEY